MWCSAADTHLKLQVSVVSGANFLTEGVFECDLAHRRSVAVCCTRSDVTQCTLYNNLYGALREPYVPVLVTRVAVIADRYTYAPPRCRTSLQNIARAGPMQFYWPSFSLSFCLVLFSLSLLSFYGLVLWAWGLRTDIAVTLYQHCTANFL